MWLRLGVKCVRVLLVSWWGLSIGESLGCIVNLWLGFHIKCLALSQRSSYWRWHGGSRSVHTQNTWGSTWNIWSSIWGAALEWCPAVSSYITTVKLFDWSEAWFEWATSDSCGRLAQCGWTILWNTWRWQQASSDTWLLIELLIQPSNHLSVAFEISLSLFKLFFQNLHLILVIFDVLVATFDLSASFL